MRIGITGSPTLGSTFEFDPHEIARVVEPPGIAGNADPAGPDHGEHHLALADLGGDMFTKIRSRGYRIHVHEHGIVTEVTAGRS